MSLHLRYISFLWQVADLGCNLNMPLLRDGARVLMKLMPPGSPQSSQYDAKNTQQCFLMGSLVPLLRPQTTLQWRTCELSAWTTPSWARTASARRSTPDSLAPPPHKCSTSSRWVAATFCSSGKENLFTLNALVVYCVAPRIKYPSAVYFSAVTTCCTCTHLSSSELDDFVLCNTFRVQKYKSKEFSCLTNNEQPHNFHLFVCF